MMKSLFQLFRRSCSYLFPWLIEQRAGFVSPFLEVWLINGAHHLNTKKANYSFGSLHAVFATVFNKFKVKDRNIKTVLILGFGTGSVASILIDDYKLNCSMEAVELDPVVVELGKKYFNVDRFNTLNLKCEDALSFINNNGNIYDLVVVDLFIDLDVPEKFRSQAFISGLKNALSPNGVLFFNSIPYSNPSDAATLHLQAELRNIFGSVLTEKLTLPDTGNWVFVCENKKAP
jgi:spermidine synthase